VVSTKAQKASFDRPPRPPPGRLATSSPDATFATEKGGFVMYRPRAGMFYSQGVGYIEREPVEQVCALATIILGESPTIDVFHDWSGVVGYDPSARVAFTAWMLEHYPRVGRVRILTRSKLVAMGVSATEFAVNALGFSVDLRVYSMRDDFEEDLLRYLGE
jgi:hypothetical protein